MIQTKNTILVEYLSKKFLVLTRLISLLLIGVYLPHTLANNMTLSPVIDLSESFQGNLYWHKPLTNPKSKEQYYIANNKGQLHLIDDNNLVKLPVLALQQYYKNFLLLNKVILHPNFAYNQQKGYNTFYTAHVEPADKAIRTLRVKDKNVSQRFPYEVVVVEWQLKRVNALKVDPESKREILRIGINHPEKSVTDMRFNPYVKSWNDNFSHLYIALAYDQTLNNSPLYSGAILRINPEKFGLRSYTTPHNNPLVNQAAFADELLIVGAQHITQFIWQKNNDQQLIVSHTFNQQPLMSLVNYGDNLLTHAPDKTLLSGDHALTTASSIVYRGREFKELRNKLLIMTKQAGRWELQSVNTSPPFQKTVVNIFSHNELTTTDDFSLFTDNYDELLLFSSSQRVIQQLNKNTASGLTDKEDATFTPLEGEENKNGSSISYYIWFLIIIGGAVAWFAKSKKSQQAVKSLLHKNYARFELSVDNKHILLFHRHQQYAAITIDVDKIIRNDIVLNGEHLLTIEADLLGFDAQLEQMLERKFIDEKRVKMVDHRTRKIELNITDDTGIVYGICLYFREGNQRLTKATYGKITDDIKEWCWFISALLAPEKTGKRIVKIVEPPLVIAKPIVKKVPNKASANTGEPTHVSQEKDCKKSSEIIDDASDSSDIDTQLIAALDKLANLKAKGFLTEDEFIRAKAKILANLQKH